MSGSVPYLKVLSPMPPLSVSQRSYLNHYGPWVLGGAVVFVAIIAELSRHHVITGQTFLYLLILIPTIIIHEVSHGVVAYWCGDSTAKDAHRLSLNPVRHIDPIGTVLVPFVLVLAGVSAFGWAKPVPVNTNRLRNPRNQTILVSLAGPAVNIVIALIAGFLLRTTGNFPFLYSLPTQQWPILDQILLLVGFTNIVIAVFNLIPIPPLDGSVLLERFLPASMLPGYYRLRMYSIIIVFAFIYLAPGALQSLFSHSINLWESVVGLG